MDGQIGVDERDSEVSLDNQGRISRQHVESWIVESSTPKTTAQVAEELGMLPADPHPYDPTTLAKSIKVKQLKHRNPYRFRVTVTYSNSVPERNQTQSENPFDDPVKVRWEDGEMEVTIDKDRDGEAILLPTGRPFNPGVKMLLPTGRLIINRNERTIDVDPNLQYRKHVNSDTFAGKEPNSMLMRSITSEMASRSGILYFPTEYIWEWNPLGWNEEILLQDTHEILFGDVMPILEEGTRQPITEPVPITSAGQKVLRSLLPGSAEFRRVNKYPVATFGAMGFPV